MTTFVADRGGVVIVVCPACGARRSVSRRQARRCSDGQGVYRTCSRGRQVRDEPDKLRAWWFARFDDADLLVLARALANRRLGGSIAAVAEHRARLKRAGAVGKGLGGTP
jgi:hypothetical protein